MLKRRIALRTMAGALAVGLMGLLALPLAALANTSDAIAQTGGMTATLPVLGSSLTVEVTLDGNGNLSAVNLDPVGTYSATKVSPHAVSFKSGDDATKVSVKAKGDKASIKASASSLDALVGSGTWSADVFGTGAKSMVNYTVGAANGVPSVTIDSVAAAAGIEATVGTPKAKNGAHGDDGEHGGSVSHASATVVFTHDGYTKKLTIKVSAGSEKHRASLSITLSGKDRQRLTGTLADLTGEHAWSGKTCDGTPVGLTYTVNADGTVTFVAATGGTAETKTNDHGFSARFTGTKLTVKVSLRQFEDGSYVLSTKSKKGHCKGQDVPNPTVNTPVTPGADQADHKGGHHGDGKSARRGDRTGSHGGDGSREARSGNRGGSAYGGRGGSSGGHG